MEHLDQVTSAAGPLMEQLRSIVANTMPGRLRSVQLGEASRKLAKAKKDKKNAPTELVAAEKEYYGLAGWTPKNGSQRLYGAEAYKSMELERLTRRAKKELDQTEAVDSDNRADLEAILAGYDAASSYSQQIKSTVKILDDQHRRLLKKEEHLRDVTGVSNRSFWYASQWSGFLARASLFASRAYIVAVAALVVAMIGRKGRSALSRSTALLLFGLVCVYALGDYAILYVARRLDSFLGWYESGSPEGENVAL